MRALVASIAATLVLSACADTPDLTAPTASSVAGQQVTVAPTGLTFSPHTTSGTVTASTNFAGVITAVVDNPVTCQVSPSAQLAVGGAGGLKTATFQVSVGALFGPCTVTLTDRKGNTATVTVQMSGDGGDWV